jgi:uncharacterized protein with HEPN domain
LADDELLLKWVLYHLRIIGEAARTVSAGFQQAHPDWPWSSMIGMRQILIHDYYDIDSIWYVVERDLPDLKAKQAPLLGAPTNPPAGQPKGKPRRSSKTSRPNGIAAARESK